MYAAVDKYIQSNIKDNYILQDYVDKSHGRSTRRRYLPFDVPKEISPLRLTQ